MFDVDDDAKGGFRRIELLMGPGRRRRWSAAEKSRIVEETLSPGVRVADVARRWQICPQQVFGWRRAARQELVASSVLRTLAADFVPIIMEATTPVTPPSRAAATPVIEVRLAGAVIRVVSELEDGAQLTAVLRAVRASVSKT